jgi:hypothetical protein
MRSVFVTVMMLAIGSALAQSPAIVDNATPGGRSVISAQLGAGQMLAELRLLALSATAQPPNVQQELRRRCELANIQVNILYRAIQVGATWAGLKAQIATVNQTIVELSTFVKQVAPNDGTLYFALGRVEFAWQRTQAQIAAAFGGFNPINPIGPVPGPQQAYIANLSRALDRQSDVLANVAKNTLPNNIWGESLDRSIREFAGSCDRLSGFIDRGVPFAVPLAEVQTRWEALARTLGSPQIGQYIAVRLQAARVNVLYIGLLRALGQAQIPLPIFPINNLKLNGVIAIGAGEGGVPVVRVYSDRRGGDFHDFMAYDPEFRGGVRVAVGDVNGDGIVDIITAPGKGMAPLVRVFDGRDLSLISQFYAYDQNFLSGVFVAAADVTGDGRAEIVCGAGDPGGPQVRAFDGMTGQVKAEFYAYDQRLQCGVRVAMGDVDGDRIPDIITAPGPGVEPVVKVFSGRNVAQLATFHAYEPAFKGGVFVASADVTRNGRAEVITGAGTNGGPHVRIFDPFAGRMLQEFYAYDRNFLGGVRVAVCDAVGDGRPDIITAPGPGIAPVVRIFRNRDGQLDREFSAFDPLFQGGAWVAGN